MQVDPQMAAKSDYDGKVHYFCCAGCKKKFDANPAQYAVAKPQGAFVQLAGAMVMPPANAAAPAAEYTCPMHPEVRQKGPGACPKCGMALEPLEITSDEANPELQEMQRRFWVSVGVAISLLVLMVLGMTGWAMPAARWIEFALATPVVLWGGWPFFQRAWASIASRNLNMFTLIALGTGTAFVFSVAAALMPQMFPAAFRTRQGELPLYFEPAAVITTLVLLGQVLELRARAQTSSAIKSLLNLAPKTARLVAAGPEREVPLDQVRLGALLRVRPGEKVPVDGIVIEGASSIDESMISG